MPATQEIVQCWIRVEDAAYALGEDLSTEQTLARVSAEMGVGPDVVVMALLHELEIGP